MNLFKKCPQRKLLSLILIGLILGGFTSFVGINHVFGQPSIIITLKWRTQAGTSSTWMGPLAADLNNDGLMEIVITGQNGVAALDPKNGSVIWSMPYGGDHVPFEIIDLNKDGIPEILMCPQYVNGSSGGGVLALHGNNGSVYWYNRNAAGKGTYIGVADINADGYPEIYSAYPGLVTALTYDGRIFASTYTYYSCWGGMTIGDTDFDGVFEVYLGERSNWYPPPSSPGRGLRAFWADNLTERWCYPDILCSSQAPVLADVDKDGDLEIIILNQRGGIAVINTDGSVNTYKGIYRYNLSIFGLTAHSNPPVADLDGDGNLELITCGAASHERFYPPKIWDLVDWKLDATLPFPSDEPPGVADIDGDGKLEIINCNPQNVTIFKYNLATKSYDIIYTIPIAMAHPFSIAQDIDGDGKLELVFDLHNSWVYVYDVEAPAPTPKPRSGLYFCSQYRTRVPVYVPPPGPQAPKITEISPNDGATNVPVRLSQLSFKLTDYQCDPINYTVITNPDIGSASGINVPNGKITIPVSGLAYSTTYTWTVTATDGAHITTKTFTFTTINLSPWYNTDWRYRKTIMINQTKVAADQTNFPVLIDLTDSDLKTKAQLDGADILFTDQNKVKLSHEIEQYDSTTGRLIAWVNIPYLSSTTDITIYMYYGNPTCENQQNSTDVWDTNHKLVLHLDESTGTHYDSTINGNNGTPFGSLVQGATGAIGSCVEFNGGYVELPRVCTSEVQFTFSAWIYARSGARYIISEWWSYQGAFLQVASSATAIEFYVNNIIVSRSITFNKWYYVVGTFDGATARLYVNDGSPASTSASNPIWPSQNMYIGDRSDHNRKFNGFIDEVRVSNIARNAAWILTEYNNQLNPTTFYSLGAEETFEGTYVLTVLIDGNGSVTINPEKTSYTQGETVTLTATPEEGYEFQGWSGDLSGSANPETITMDGNKTVTATFTQKQYYTLTIIIIGNGTVTKNPDYAVYAHGEIVTLTATADPGWTFAGWSGDISSSENPVDIVMNSSKVVFATFTQDQYTLTIIIEGEGTITKIPDQSTYTYGTTIQLIASANIGWSFSHWSGNITSSDNPITFIITSNMTITAHFKLKQYTITASVSGTGGTIEPSGIVTVTHGEDITFTITPNTGYHILDVLVDGEPQGAITTYTFYAVSMNHTITAFFAPNEYTLTVNVSPEGGGTVTLNNTGPYYYGDAVQLTAEPNTGWYFSQWEGDMLGRQNPAIIIIDGDKSITAVFTQEKYTLNITIIGKGSVIKEPDKTIYTGGETVTLTATAEPGWTFSGWGGDLSGLVNPATITMTGNKTVTATFTMNQWWCRDWQYRRTITINHTKVSGTLTDFPVLIEILDSSLIGKTQPNGYDFVFTDANSVKLNHQIEFYNSTIGHLIVWVKVPYLSSTTDTILYMYYGNLNCENQQNPTEVWDTNYMLVLHLNENTGTHYDSTINGNNGTPFKGVLQGVTGKIDGADTFDGGTDYIEVPHSDTLAGYIEAFTVSFWIRLEDISRRQTILCKYDTSGNMRSWQIEYDPLNRPNNPFWFFASQDGITYSEWWASFVPQANTWYYVTVIWEANSIPKFYINGVQVATVGTSTISSIFNNVGVPLRIGRSIYSTRCFKGSLDEITISNQARSADWILTAYNNQFNPTTFYSVGAEETFQETYILTVHVDGNGSVTIIPEKTAYTQGETVTLTATPGEGYEFQGWSGDLTGTENPATIIITGNMNITAHFTLKQYTINASVMGTGGTIKPSGLVIVYHGEDITFTITPDTGYHILDVLVDGESQGPISTYTFYAVDTNHTITVIFAPDEY